MEESVKNVQPNATPEQGTTKIASQAQSNSSTGKDFELLDMNICMRI